MPVGGTCSRSQRRVSNSMSLCIFFNTLLLPSSIISLAFARSATRLIAFQRLSLLIHLSQPSAVSVKLALFTQAGRPFKLFTQYARVVFSPPVRLPLSLRVRTDRGTALGCWRGVNLKRFAYIDLLGLLFILYLHTVFTVYCLCMACHR